jgi:hypothetical protein
LKVAYSPSNSSQLAICGKEGLVIWKKSEKNEIGWKIKKELAGSFTTLHYSHSGRYIALASCYSTNVYLCDIVKEKLYPTVNLSNVVREIQWTVEDHYLLVSLPNAELRIIETEKFMSDKWTNFSQPISTFFSTNTENETFFLIENSCLMYKLIKSKVREYMGNTPYIFANYVYNFSFRE